MPMRQFKKTKRVLTRAEQVTMHEEAVAASKRYWEGIQEKERLVAEGKLRKIVTVSPDGKTKRFRYEPIDTESKQ